MSKKGSTKDVRPIARQFVLSGFVNSIQQEDVYSDGSKKQLVRENVGAKGPDWKQKSYQATINFIVEEVSVDSDKHIYYISINDDANLSIATYSTRGKKATSENVTVPQTQSKTKKLALVYGIHEDGSCTFSHPSGQTGARILADVYSFLLGQIDDAIQFRLQQLADKARNDDTGERIESTLPQENVGEHPKARRGKKVLPQVLPKTIPENSPLLVAYERAVLGNGYENEPDKPGGMDDNTFIGSALENFTPEF